MIHALGIRKCRIRSCYFQALLSSQDSCKSFSQLLAGSFCSKYKEPNCWDSDVCSKVRASSQASQARVSPPSYPVGLTLRPMNCSPPGSSVHGILPARILKRVVVSFSRGSSRPRDQIHVSCLLHWQAGFVPLAPRGKPPIYGLRSSIGKQCCKDLKILSWPLFQMRRNPKKGFFPRDEFSRQKLSFF